MRPISVLWRRLDQPGHESARLISQDLRWLLSGAAVFAHNRQSCRLDYVIACNAQWQTLSCQVSGWIGDDLVDIHITADAACRWRLNGAECVEVAGCSDIDLGFSPSTNLLPIRRLDLAVGQEAKVTAAWLGFPCLTLQPLDQLYRRINSATYRYESAGGSFVAELQVNETGFVTHYPSLWRIEEVD